MKILIKLIIVVACIVLLFILFTNPYSLVIMILLGPLCKKPIKWLMKAAANNTKDIGF